MYCLNVNLLEIGIPDDSGSAPGVAESQRRLQNICALHVANQESEHFVYMSAMPAMYLCGDICIWNTSRGELEVSTPAAPRGEQGILTMNK